ncbi:7154_t:CDS:2 [Ambispora gerdemannii]|uniref:7154_t:CDS:1 n=1 Tax=Ambispora gerdemannii TaxID=144530 RepID=A0A9N9AX86_9GLOM|nr:7154_t:CDS:2 [Ambispora gerdemannii]
MTSKFLKTFAGNDKFYFHATPQELLKIDENFSVIGICHKRSQVWGKGKNYDYAKDLENELVNRLKKNEFKESLKNNNLDNKFVKHLLRRVFEEVEKNAVFEEINQHKEIITGLTATILILTSNTIYVAGKGEYKIAFYILGRDGETKKNFTDCGQNMHFKSFSSEEIILILSSNMSLDFVAKETNGVVYTYKCLEENLKEFAKFYLTSSETYGWQFSEYRFPFDDIIAFVAITIIRLEGIELKDWSKIAAENKTKKIKEVEESWRFLGKKKLDLSSRKNSSNPRNARMPS